MITTPTVSGESGQAPGALMAAAWRSSLCDILGGIRSISCESECVAVGLDECGELVA